MHYFACTDRVTNKRKRGLYPDDDKRSIYTMMLVRNGRTGRLKNGVTKVVSDLTKVPPRCLRRIWENGNRGGVNAVVNKKAKNCGRKRVVVDTDAM